jgi:hypothetical protein
MFIGRYQICYFGADRKSNMAARANNVFWLVETLKIFLSEKDLSFNQLEHIIGPGSHVGFPICTKITNLVENLPMNISVKLGPNLFSGYRRRRRRTKWCLGGPLPNCYFCADRISKMAITGQQWFTIGPYGNFIQRPFFEKREPPNEHFCQAWSKSVQWLQTQTTTDAKWWQKLTWPFGPGELKRGGGRHYFCSLFYAWESVNKYVCTERKNSSDYIYRRIRCYIDTGLVYLAYAMLILKKLLNS